MKGILSFLRSTKLRVMAAVGAAVAFAGNASAKLIDIVPDQTDPSITTVEFDVSTISDVAQSALVAGIAGIAIVIAAAIGFRWLLSMLKRR